MNPLRKLDGEASPGPWKATGDSYAPVVGPHQKTIRKGANKGEPQPGSEVRVVALDNHAACSDPDCCQDSPYVAVAPSDAALIVTLRNALPEIAELYEAAERAVFQRCDFCDGCGDSRYYGEPDDKCQHCGGEGRHVRRDARPTLAHALAALKEKSSAPPCTCVPVGGGVFASEACAFHRVDRGYTTEPTPTAHREQRMGGVVCVDSETGKMREAVAFVPSPPPTALTKEREAELRAAVAAVSAADRWTAFDGSPPYSVGFAGKAVVSCPSFDFLSDMPAASDARLLPAAKYLAAAANAVPSLLAALDASRAALAAYEGKPCARRDCVSGRLDLTARLAEAEERARVAEGERDGWREADAAKGHEIDKLSRALRKVTVDLASFRAMPTGEGRAALQTEVQGTMRIEELPSPEVTGYAHVASPRAVRGGADPRGFRHACRVGEDHTLCGRNCEGWETEVGGFERGNVTCLVCTRALEVRHG